MAKEQFFHPESADLLKTLDEAAHRSGLSRGQAFDDFLHMVVCSLSGGRMEQQYLEVVKRHSRGKPGKRGCDSLAELFGRTVAAMEETRDEMKDILGDLFQGAITYGEAGQIFTPEPVGRMMARMMVSDVPEDEQREVKRVGDPACGSGRLLLAVAEMQRHWTFVGHAFEIGGYLWLNDSTCPDGAQEYAVLKRDGGNGKPAQIESITFGWCDEAKALEYIRDTLDGKDDLHSFRKEVDPVLQSPAEHGRCHHCA